ncbi:MAG TPA: AEC family transporter [Baekduia sp.]|nr:AEC family transporter [Baekduia sp.]
MLLVALAIAVSTAAGVVADRRWPARAERLTSRGMDVLLWGVLPPIAFFVVARLELTSGVGVGLALAYPVLWTVGALAYLGATRVLHLPAPSAGAVVTTSVLANTGYLGIPLCAAFLGQDAIAPAVAYDSVVSAVMLYTVGFGVGAALGTTAGETPRERARAFVTRNPVLAAVVLGLLAPDALAPDVLVDVAELAAIALLPVGFFLLGVHLTHESEGGALRLPPPLSPPVVLVLGLRLAVAPALLIGLGTLLVDDLPDAYLIQAAMPSGINSLIVAHVYGLDLRLTAAAVAWTTAAVVAVALVAGVVA